MRKKYIFNIQAFDSVINATTSAASGNNLAPEIKTYYSDYLIQLAEAQLVHDQFGQKRNIPSGNGKSIEFRQFTPLAKITDALVEGVTPDGQALDTSTITATVKQYGGYVVITDILDLTAIDNIKTEAVQLIGSQAGRSLDTVVREVLNGGTNVQYHEGERANRAAIRTRRPSTAPTSASSIRTWRLTLCLTMHGLNGTSTRTTMPCSPTRLARSPMCVLWRPQKRRSLLTAGPQAVIRRQSSTSIPH